MSTNLSDNDVRDLVAKAFVIEAITDKPGCTTRYQDLEGKPLQDFIHAGINASRYFELKSNKDDIFTHFPEALLASNTHKSTKYINFGLLEIMFPAVVARLQCDSPKKVVNQIVNKMKHKSNNDVQAMLECRRIAWQTSTTEYKRHFSVKDYQEVSSPYDFYMKLLSDFNENTSNYQWALQYKLGLPILREFFDSYMSRDEYIETTKTVFRNTTKLFPEVGVGTQADMCAAALFLYFSYNTK